MTSRSRPCIAISQPTNSETITGYYVYAVDTTPNERPEAETLPDWGSLKSEKDEPVRYGHKYSWLVRLVPWDSSWVAPVDIQRVETALSDSQVRELELRNDQPKVVVADSLYGNHIFLAGFVLV